MARRRTADHFAPSVTRQRQEADAAAPPFFLGLQMPNLRTVATTTWLSLAFCLLSLTTSCAVRSISSTGRPYPGQNTTYAGELNDLDVVGRPSTILTSVPPFTFTRGARILLVQSGAMFPDDPMLQGVAAHFSVGSASGIPSLGLTNAEGMRAAAQRGGYDAVVAYWGVLESRTKATADSVVTMIPVVVADRERRASSW